jgi:hypothetical protein
MIDESVVIAPGAVVVDARGTKDPAAVGAAVEEGVSAALGRRQRHANVKLRQRSA